MRLKRTEINTWQMAGTELGNPERYIKTRFRQEEYK